MTRSDQMTGGGLRPPRFAGLLVHGFLRVRCDDCAFERLVPLSQCAHWREVLDPVVARYRGQGIRRLLRADAAFALPDVYEYLEAEGFHYAIRLPAQESRAPAKRRGDQSGKGARCGSSPFAPTTRLPGAST